MSDLSECTHCGLEIRGRAFVGEDDDALFCCGGCRAVYRAIRGAGLDEFYRHREHFDPQAARPADEPGLEDGVASMFDAPSFLNEHADKLDDGTRRIELYLEGVHCGGCVWLVERMPAVVDGVVEARLQLSRAKMTVRWDPEAVALSEIAGWLAKFGFRAHPLRSDSIERRSSAAREMLVRVGICWAVAINVMLLTIAVYAGLDAAGDPVLYTAIHWVTFGLTTVSLAAGGMIFFRRAVGGLKMRRLSMDVPISLGILVGFGHSGWATITGSGEVWFDSIAVLIAALSTARYLQIRGNSLAADAAERLISLLPKRARRYVDGSGDTKLETVPSEALEVGDVVRVRAGDAIPVDGRVVDGNSRVSRSVLTGESRPEPIGDGDEVEAGCTNVGNPVDIRVTATGDQTRIGALMQWLETGEADSAPVVQLADRLGGAFVAFVLVAAAVTAVAWYFIEPSRVVGNVVALLVIACPCALGMATPLALTVGLGQASKRGIHIKRDAVIEGLEQVTDVVLDKTGTLTEGRPRVVDVTGDAAAVELAAALERHSNHPVADAIVRRADNTEAASVRDVEEISGAGIRGVVDGVEVAAGRLTWFDRIDPSMQRWAEQHSSRGRTPVGIAVDGELRAVAAVGDSLRRGARRAVDELIDRGMRVHLVSGDHPDVVDRVGVRLGIRQDRTRGGVEPEQKLAYVRRLRDESPEAVVAMVGDGVNDAAALRSADVGIAVQGGTTVSLVAADVFLVDDGLEPLCELLSGTDRVMAVVRRNLIGSGIYNLFGISLAAAGFITPLLAAILMPISSLAVVGSSLIQDSFPPGDDAGKPGVAGDSATRPADLAPATGR